MLITAIITVLLTITTTVCREHMAVLIIQKYKINYWIKGSSINRDWVSWRINTNRWVTKCIWRNAPSSPGLITTTTIETLIITTTTKTRTIIINRTNKTIPAITYPAYHHQSYQQIKIPTSATHRSQFRGWNKPAG